MGDAVGGDGCTDVIIYYCSGKDIASGQFVIAVVVVVEL